MNDDFFPIGSRGPAYFPAILVKKKTALKKDFFKRKLQNLSKIRQ